MFIYSWLDFLKEIDFSCFREKHERKNVDNLVDCILLSFNLVSRLLNVSI